MTTLVAKLVFNVMASMFIWRAIQTDDALFMFFSACFLTIANVIVLTPIPKSV